MNLLGIVPKTKQFLLDADITPDTREIIEACLKTIEYQSKSLAILCQQESIKLVEVIQELIQAENEEVLNEAWVKLYQVNLEMREVLRPFEENL